MHIDGRGRGSAPNSLLDYFPEDFLLVIDESHVDRAADRRRCTRATCRASARSSTTASGCRRRWTTGRCGGRSSSSGSGRRSTCRPRPGPTSWPRPAGSSSRSSGPTGLVDPEVILKPTKGQIDDLLHEISERAERNERVLVTTLTKKMAEDLTDYLLDKGVRVRYLHSEVDTLRRVELLRELRLGEYDVLVGINLLREGLDLPEVSLVSILDADKEGFLRSARSLIQTIGRAARNVSGQVHMYADKVTPSMEEAIDETQRRREKQIAYNLAAGVDPQPLRKKIADITDLLAARGRRHRGAASASAAQPVARQGRRPGGRGTVQADAGRGRRPAAQTCRPTTWPTSSRSSPTQMHQAAADLHFELAARLRDEIGDLKKELRQMVRGAGSALSDARRAARATAWPSRGRGPTSRGRATSSPRSATRSSRSWATESVGSSAGRTARGRRVARSQYPDDASVMAYIGRSGWNTLRLGGAIPDDELLEAVDASYDTVVAKLPRYSAAP